MPNHAKRRAGPRSTHTLTLDDNDVKLLQLSGLLSSDIGPGGIKSLRRGLNQSKKTHVCVHVVLLGGEVVCKIDLNNADGHPPTVGDLRTSLISHFGEIAAGYEEAVEKAILSGHLGRRGGTRFVGGRPVLPLYGAFRSRYTSRENPMKDQHYWCIPLAGVTFTSTSDDLNGISLIPEFWSSLPTPVSIIKCVLHKTLCNTPLVSHSTALF